MASRIQAMGPSPHTAGIFADMSVDGPVIGTLVVVVDRAKNLPNRKTMGKQNPYCAARLGKEANKTETDQRGGQTPRWDQELRFTVHDSMDYHNLKISVFSEDKRTDLIGEAWINLDDIVKPGGGKGDLWQGLNCKGKYAGELRIELTYYDSRPKPEKAEGESVVGELSKDMSTSKVKRRPLPSNTPSGSVTPESIQPRGVPGRAKHGPRDLNTPPRANSIPPETAPSAEPQQIQVPEEIQLQQAQQQAQQQVQQQLQQQPQHYPPAQPPQVPRSYASTLPNQHTPLSQPMRANQPIHPHHQPDPSYHQPLSSHQPAPLHYQQAQPIYQPSHSHQLSHAQDPVYTQPGPAYSSSPSSMQQNQSFDHHYETQHPYPEPERHMIAQQESAQQQDFLPELVPSDQQRWQPQHVARQGGQSSVNPRPRSYAGVEHSQQGPPVPSVERKHYEDEYTQLQTNYADPIPDVDYQHQYISAPYEHHNAMPTWHSQHTDPVDETPYQQDDEDKPPPPPLHSNSLPAVPHRDSAAYSTVTPPAARHIDMSSHARFNSVPSTSPLQNIERVYSQPQSHPQPGIPHHLLSSDEHYTPIAQPTPVYGTPHAHNQPHSQHPPSQNTSRVVPYPNSFGEPHHTSAVSRSHPLSQEVQRPQSPVRDYPADFSESLPQPASHTYSHEHRGRDVVPVPRRREVSPQPPAQPQNTTPSSAPPRTLYSMQHPIRAFESSDESPLATSRPAPPTSIRSTPLRKSVSPGPSPSNNATAGTPFSPDSFDVHNPNAASTRAQLQSRSSSPHTPYHIRRDADPYQREATSGPIVGWRGQSIDPSDHLPIDSWAPEPEKKTPTKSYGQGRDRDFGPRKLDNNSSRHLSKDTVVSFRSKNNSTSAIPNHTSSHPQDGTGRAKLQKKTRIAPLPNSSSSIPSNQRYDYSSSFSSAAPVPNPYDRQQTFSSNSPFSSTESHHGNGYTGPGANDYSHDALDREIASIDIGVGSGSSRRSLPAPVAYVPVRSHKDRRTLY